MFNNHWKLLKVVADGEYLEIDGVSIWPEKWIKLDINEIEVPHPNYPNQKHKIWPYYIENNANCIVFMAGELSNCVWCFYVPVDGQPYETTKGMTVNEKLYESKLVVSFEQAIREGNSKKAVDLLIISGLSSLQATDTVSAIQENPGKYGY